MNFLDGWVVISFWYFHCRYIEDCITKAEALQLLRQSHPLKASREKELLSSGLPAYTTAAGWLGYSEEKIVKLRSVFSLGSPQYTVSRLTCLAVNSSWLTDSLISSWRLDQMLRMTSGGAPSWEKPSAGTGSSWWTQTRSGEFSRWLVCNNGEMYPRYRTEMWAWTWSL